MSCSMAILFFQFGFRSMTATALSDLIQNTVIATVDWAK